MAPSPATFLVANSAVVNQADVLTLFQKLLPLEIFWTAMKQAEVRENNRVYTSAVVIWLMICQRLRVEGTLESAVLELLRGLPGMLALWLWAFANRSRSWLDRDAPEVSRFSCMLFLSVPGFLDYAGPADHSRFNAASQASAGISAIRDVFLPSQNGSFAQRLARGSHH
jgi:hypothetical protein